MEKQFQEWIYIKRTLHEKVILPPYVREGEIWWTSIGENIGHEINGKSKFFFSPSIDIQKALSLPLFSYSTYDKGEIRNMVCGL